jgi:hypothetical protein
MADGFSRVTKELLGLGLAIAGANGLKNLVVGTVQAADALNLQSRALDVNAQALNKWVNTARRADSSLSAGAAQGAFGGMIRTLGGVLTRQITPQQAGLPQLQALGITNPDWANWEHFAQQVVEGFQRHQDAFPGQRASLAAAIPGGDVLLQIANQFKTTGELQRALADSVTATQEQTDAARRLTEQMSELRQAFERQFNKGIPLIEPGATEAAKGVKDVVEGRFSSAFQHGVELDKMAVRGVWNFLTGLFEETPSGMRGARHARHRRHGMAAGAVDEPPVEQLYQPELGDIPTPRARPRIFMPGQKIGDRFPGLGQTSASGAGGSVNNSRSIRIDQVTLTLPPGTRDPQAFADRFTSAVSAIEAQQGPR